MAAIFAMGLNAMNTTSKTNQYLHFTATDITTGMDHAPSPIPGRLPPAVSSDIFFQKFPSVGDTMNAHHGCHFL
jgi:hypothetical protein